jgi:hypothetical protein
MSRRLKSERAKEGKVKKAMEGERSGRTTDEDGAKSECKEWRWAREQRKKKVCEWMISEFPPVSFRAFCPGEVTMATAADQALSASYCSGPLREKPKVVEKAGRTGWTIQMTCRISPTLMRRNSMSMQVLPPLQPHAPPSLNVL